MALSRASKLCWRRKRVGGRVRKAASHQARKGKYAFHFKLSSRAPHCLSPPANRGRENSNILGSVCVSFSLRTVCTVHTCTRAVDSRGVLPNRGCSSRCSSVLLLGDEGEGCPVIKLFQKYWIYQHFNYLFTAEFLD